MSSSIVTVKPLATTVSPVAGFAASPSHVETADQFPVATANLVAIARYKGQQIRDEGTLLLGQPLIVR